MKMLFDNTSRVLTEMIQGTALRHRVLAANLANAETPEYQAQDVQFSIVLDDAQRRREAAAGIAGVQATVIPDEETSVRRDGNTVDLDRQMTKLAQNTGWHNAMLQILAGRLATVKSAIRDRS
jgi:flagellar basal-body rod protein FlgB